MDYRILGFLSKYSQKTKRLYFFPTCRQSGRNRKNASCLPDGSQEFFRFIKSVTLIELIITMTLFSVIIIAAGSFEITANRLFLSSERKAAVLNEMTYVLEHINKSSLRVHSMGGGSGVQVTPNTRIAFRLDNNPPTPLVFTDDIWVAYQFDTATSNISYCPNWNTAGAGSCTGAWEVLTSRLNSVTIATTPYVSLQLTGVYNPAIANDSSINPNVTVQTTIYCPGYSS